MLFVKVRGFLFFGFQQLNLYSLEGTTNLDILAAFGILKNRIGKVVYSSDKAMEWIKDAEYFRECAQKKRNYNWFMDLSNIFDNIL